MTLYVDSSALIKRYVAEDDSDAAEAILLADTDWVTGHHTFIEVSLAISRRLGEAERRVASAAFDSDWQRTFVVALDEVVCRRAAELGIATGARSPTPCTSPRPSVREVGRWPSSRSTSASVRPLAPWGSRSSARRHPAPGCVPRGSESSPATPTETAKAAPPPIGDTMSMAPRMDTESPAPHAADRHDLIRVQGARVNNLKDVSVELPKRRLTVFTGVSGSGKSSLVFGTIAAESQRMINETYSAFVQGFMPTLARPEVDVLDGLTTAIIVDQERMGANARSTVGTATDANAMLRILFSRLGQPHIGSPQAYSFNVASVRATGAITVERGARTQTEKATFNRTGGMCERCEGMGSVTDFDLSALYDATRSLNEGALTIPGYSMEGWYGRIYRGCGFFDPDKPISSFTKRELHDLLYKEPTKIKVEGINLTYEGLIPRIQSSMLSKDIEALQPHIRAFVERAVTFTVCPECAGTRLNEAARSSRIGGVSIADACAMQISDLAGWVRGLDEPSVGPLLGALRHTLDSFVEIGLGYLVARPSVGHAVGWRVAAHEDDPPPRLVAHRRHLCLR